MAQDGDDLLSLPGPPPPRPAARREAIEAALRKFDGIEDTPARLKPRRRLGWAALHRRPAGALVAAAAVAIIGIPAAQIALRDPPATIAPEAGEPAAVDARPEPTQSRPTAEPPRPAPDQAAADAPIPAAEQPAARSSTAEDRLGLAPSRAERKAVQETPAFAAPVPAPMVAAPAAPPPPPPPPPPPAEAQADMASENNIVVTGSRVRRSNLESASPVTVIDSTDDFLSRLRDALGANNRRAILGLVALPLRVSFDGDVRTYRTRRDIDRDLDRIFTAEVRRSALNLQPDALTTRDGGRLRGNGRIWFGCGKRECSSGTLKVREIVAER